MSNGIDSALQVVLSGAFGALASVGQLLGSAKILTYRRMVASFIGGITGGIFSGAVFVTFFPDLAQNYLVVSGAGAAGGAFGVHAILLFYLAKHAPEVLKRGEQPDSVTLQQLFDSGEYQKDEIEAMIAEVAARRKAQEKKKGNPQTT